MFKAVPSSLLALSLVVGTAAADPKNPTYDDDVLPVLKQHCVGCHSADKQKGGLDVSTFAALKAGGSSGDVLKPGDPDKSRLYTLTAHTEEPKMPPKANRIPDVQLATLKLWVEQGGRENAGSKVVAAKPKVDIGLKTPAKGKPDVPPMPVAGKLKLDPVLVARRPNAVVALAASPWAPLVAVGGQKQVVLYHAGTGAVLGVLPFEHGQINSLKFSRNGKLLLAAGGRGGASGKAVLFNVETGDKVTEVGSAESDAILAADLSPDQTMIAVGTPTRMVRIYATADGAVLHAIKKHTDWVTAVEFSPDGVLLATGDRNGGLFAWEAATAREFYTLRGHTAAITDVSWRPDSNVLASSSEDGSVRLWEMENGNQIKTWGAHGGGTHSVRFGMDGKLATTGRDKFAKLWDGGGNPLKQSAEPLPDLGLRVAVTADNATVVVGDWSGVVRLVAADGRTIGVLDANPPLLAERVKQAEAAVTAAEGKAKQFADAATAAQANAAKAAADLAAAQKAVTDTAAAAAQTKAAADAAKVEADKAAAAVNAANAAVQAKAAAVKAETDKATAAKAAADKAVADKTAAAKAEADKAAAAKAAAEKDPKLADAAKTAADGAAKVQAELAASQKSAADVAASGKAAVEKVQADLAAAQKAATDAAAAAKAAADKLTASQQAMTAAATAAAEAPKRVPPLQQAAKATADAVAPAQAASQAAAAELAAVKARLDQTRGGVVASGK